MIMDLVAKLGKEAGIKVAESFVLPPRKTTPTVRRVRPSEEKPDFDGEGGPSQSPHRYGVTRKKAVLD